MKLLTPLTPSTINIFLRMSDAGNKDFSASTRGHCVPDGMGSYMYVGFRVALYLK